MTSMPAALERFTEAGFRAAGFSGFQTVGELRSTKLEAVPRDPGVYVVIRVDSSSPTYLAQSAGGWFKGNDPTVPTATLAAKWVAGAQLLYCGKATGGSKGANGLGKRLGLLLRYGAGKPVGHQGGRYLWQVAGADEFLIAWRAAEDPTAEENRLLADFFEAYGAYPFANIAGPRA
ncbi:MAG: hypothetical protein AABZ33_04000 [Chloroflexota bacterium]